MFNKDGHCDLYGTEQFMDFMAVAACDFLWTYDSSKDNCILSGDLLQVLSVGHCVRGVCDLSRFDFDVSTSSCVHVALARLPQLCVMLRCLRSCAR